MTLPLGLLALVFACAGSGLLGLMELWNQKVRTQLMLDGCASQLALKLRDTHRRLEDLNQEITVARGIAAAAIAAGDTEAALQASRAIDVLVGQQELTLGDWEQTRARALASRDCPVDPSHPTDLLRPPAWFRPPRDPVGQNTLEWPSGTPSETRFFLAKGGRHTHASARKNLARQWIASFELQSPGPGTL